jgi:hypothetical protein
MFLIARDYITLHPITLSILIIAMLALIYFVRQIFATNIVFAKRKDNIVVERSILPDIAKTLNAAINFDTQSSLVYRQNPSLARASQKEIKVLNVHPRDEQATINLMMRFKWELRSSTPVKIKDTHLEQRDDKVWSVTKTEEFVHLVFERDLNTRNLGRIRALEAEFYSIKIPKLPGLVFQVIIIFIGIMTLGAGGAGIGVPLIVAGIIWLVLNIVRRPKVVAEIQHLKSRQFEILEECDRL